LKNRTSIGKNEGVGTANSGQDLGQLDGLEGKKKGKDSGQGPTDGENQYAASHLVTASPQKKNNMHHLPPPKWPWINGENREDRAR